MIPTGPLVASTPLIRVHTDAEPYSERTWLWPIADVLKFSATIAVVVTVVVMVVRYRRSARPD